MTSDDKDFFEKFGLELSHDKPEIGETYSIYGMVTEILEEDLDDFTVMVNFNIAMKMNIRSEEQRNTLLERSFEPGIFVATFTEHNEDAEEGEPSYWADCRTVVFGRKQSKEMI
jgi:hypothetical protein